MNNLRVKNYDGRNLAVSPVVTIVQDCDYSNSLMTEESYFLSHSGQLTTIGHEETLSFECIHPITPDQRYLGNKQ